ncbi:MAG: hypothetical protein GKR89_36085 [Candidatus Latescibacteria bacterium]|nr:hypothetical protein [Candidatus Latescibacterota bacterium]
MGRIEPENSATDPLVKTPAARALEDRWRRIWHGAFYFLLGLIAVLILFKQALPWEQRGAFVGLALVWGGWYWGWAVCLPLADRSLSKKAIFFLVEWGLWIGLMLIDQSATFLAVGCFIHVFLFLPLRWGLGGALLLAGLLIGSQAFWHGRVSGPMVVLTLIGVGVSMLLALFIQAISRHGEQLQQLTAQLQQANSELEAANRQIQLATQRKSQFLASMSHELRTPLNAIKGFTRLVLRRQTELTPRNRANLEKVTQASDHLLALINDLLDLSKIEVGRMEVNAAAFAVEPLVAGCVATVSPLVGQGVELRYEIAPDLDQAHTDEARLRQMLINLLSNAIKFTAAGQVAVQAARENDQLVIRVADTGQGIPAAELATIFDEYRQVQGSDPGQKGTGLGLSITRRFAQLLGGGIEVQSQLGEGTVFTLRLPLVYAGG